MGGVWGGSEGWSVRGGSVRGGVCKAKCEGWECGVGV